MSRHHPGARGHARPTTGGRPAPERRPATATAPGVASASDEPEPIAVPTRAPAPQGVVAPAAADPEVEHVVVAARALRAIETAPTPAVERAEVRQPAEVSPPAEPAEPAEPRPTPIEIPLPPGTTTEPAEGAGCTAPQLRRFIKSRAYVPMHELRRRFGIEGGDDDVTGVDLVVGRIYVGLPGREGRLLGELLRAGDIGYELSFDPITPIVVGVYPMRPVARP